MRKIALVSLMLLAMTLPSFAFDQLSGSYADAKARAAKLGKPLLIDFFTEW